MLLCKETKLLSGTRGCSNTRRAQGKLYPGYVSHHIELQIY